jgi:hypothetical protein
VPDHTTTTTCAVGSGQRLTLFQDARPARGPAPRLVKVDEFKK